MKSDRTGPNPWTGQKGSAPGTLISTIFLGLVLVVIVFSLMSVHPFFIQLGYWGLVAAGCTIVLVMALAYRIINRIKSRRFQKGVKDSMMLRAMMNECIARDTHALERHLLENRKSEMTVLNDLFQAQMENILDTDCRNMSDVRLRFKKSGIKPLGGQNFHELFQTRASYGKNPLPEPITKIKELSGSAFPQIRSRLERLKICREKLFTLMGDYLEIFPPSRKVIESLFKTYPYRPLEVTTAQRIAFAIKVIDYLRDYESECVPKRKLFEMKHLASRRVKKLRRLIKRYQNSWRYLVKAYDSL